jgi:hypothetical protein
MMKLLLTAGADSVSAVNGGAAVQADPGDT